VITPLKQRIIDALRTFPEYRTYYKYLMYAVWPEDKYPNALRHSSNGGPAGVCMPFGKALREMEEEGIIWRPNRGEIRYGQPDVQLMWKWRGKCKREEGK